MPQTKSYTEKQFFIEKAVPLGAEGATVKLWEGYISNPRSCTCKEVNYVTIKRYRIEGEKQSLFKRLFYSKTTPTEELTDTTRTKASKLLDPEIRISRPNSNNYETIRLNVKQLKYKNGEPVGIDKGVIVDAQRVNLALWITLPTTTAKMDKVRNAKVTCAFRVEVQAKKIADTLPGLGTFQLSTSTPASSTAATSSNASTTTAETSTASSSTASS